MRIYIETNFILELVFQQEQSHSCEQLLKLCESGAVDLIIPAYCLVEPNEKLLRQEYERRELQQRLNKELIQLSRAAPYDTRIAKIDDISQLLIISNQEDQKRFIHYRSRFFEASENVALTSEILQMGAVYETSFLLGPQDAIVLATIIFHLNLAPRDEESCFLNKNSKDFGTPNIKSELDQYHCKLIFDFDDGLSYVQARL